MATIVERYSCSAHTFFPCSTKFHLSRVTFAFGVLDNVWISSLDRQSATSKASEYRISLKSSHFLQFVCRIGIRHFEFWHQIHKQSSRKPQSTKFHWINSFVAFWFTIWNFQLVVISDFVVSNGVNGPNCPNCLKCSNCPNCSTCSNCPKYSTVRTCFEQVRTGSNAVISNRTQTVRNISDPCTYLVHTLAGLLYDVRKR